MLKVNEINAAYGKIGVLWDVSMAVEENEIVALVGANAAGKTTLLHAVCGLVPVVSGTVEFRGNRISGMPTYKIAGMGISLVPEGAKLFPDMTVLENLEMGAYGFQNWARRDETLEQVYGFFPVLKKRAGQLARSLSGGERQMVAMARSLMSRPSLVMFDEPSYGLAPLIVKKLFQFIRTLHAQGMTIVVVEQNVRHALEVSARGYVLESGRIVMQGRSSELLSSEHVAKAYLGL